MSHPFDATMKDIVHLFASDYAEQFECAATGPLMPLNVDLSTVSAATDIVLAESDPPKTIFDFNFQASASEELPRRVLLYHALLHHRYNVPIKSIIVLLRQAADHPTLTGRLHYQTLPRNGKMDFRYDVVRMWRKQAKQLLAGGLGTLPLAVLGKLPSKRSFVDALQDVVEEIAQRVTAEAERPVADRLIAGTIVLCGLRISKAEIHQLFERVPIMKESTAYEAILEQGIEKGIEKGRVEEARRNLLRLGELKFGKPIDEVLAAINRVDDPVQLETLIDRVLLSQNWDELVSCVKG